MSAPLSKLHYHQRRRVLDVISHDGACGSLSAEFLRVHSPSAEVRGHGQPKLVANKRDVAIIAITQVGHYAVKLSFDDGHNTGLYSYTYLQQLVEQHDIMWQHYLQKLKLANASREPRIAIKTV